MNPHQVEMNMNYELLYKELLFAVVKMASFSGCVNFISFSLESWGDG